MSDPIPAGTPAAPPVGATLPMVRVRGARKTFNVGTPEEVRPMQGIDLEIPVSTLQPEWPAMAEAFQQQVAAAGIRAKIVQVPTDGYFDQIWMKRPVSMTRWNDRPADGVLNEVYRGGARWNESFLKDAKFDAMLDAARTELNFEKRKARYIEAQDYLWENTGTLVGFHAVINVARTTRVKNLDAVENFGIRWHKLSVD